MKKTTEGNAATKRVVLYVRRSVDDGDATRSLPEQERDCRRYGAQLGSTVDVYRENQSGVSGFERPVFMTMISAAERGEFDVIVVLDVSRFGRFDPDERGYWLTRLRRAHVEVRYVHDDERLAGEAGPIMGAVLQHSAREHSIKTALRVTMGHVAAVEKGFWPGGIAPLGYKLVKRPGWDGKGRRDSTLVVNEAEAKVVREAFRLYLTGLGYQRVVEALNAAGHRTRKGGLFTSNALAMMLANPVYKGDLVRTQPRRCRVWAFNNTGSKFYRGSSQGPVKVGETTDGYAKIGAVPALVSAGDWDRAQEQARARTREHSGGRPGVFVGLAKCGVCSGPLVQMTGRTVVKNKGRYSYLRCRRCREHGGAGTWGECKLVGVNYHKLRDAVLELLRAEVKKIDAKLLARELRATLPVLPKVDVKALEGRRKRLAANADALLAEGDMTDAFTRERLAKLRQDDAALAREIEAARSAERTAPDVEGMIAAAVEAAQQLQAPDTAEGEEALRGVFQAFVKRIEVAPAPRGVPRPVSVEIYTPKAVALVSHSTPHPCT